MEARALSMIVRSSRGLRTRPLDHCPNPGCVTLGKLLNLSVPLFCHVQNRGCNRTYFIGTLGGLHKLACKKVLEQCLAYGKGCVN